MRRVVRCARARAFNRKDGKEFGKLAKKSVPFKGVLLPYVTISRQLLIIAPGGLRSVVERGTTLTAQTNSDRLPKGIVAPIEGILGVWRLAFWGPRDGRLRPLSL